MDPHLIDPAEHNFLAQLRDRHAGGIHASWPGPHAAALWSLLQEAHSSGGPVQQVEWGSYEVEVDAAAVRQLLGSAGNEPVESLEVGPPGQRVRLVGSPGQQPPGSIDLEALSSMIDDGHRYLVSAEMF